MRSCSPATPATAEYTLRVPLPSSPLEPTAPTAPAASTEAGPAEPSAEAARTAAETQVETPPASAPSASDDRREAARRRAAFLSNLSETSAAAAAASASAAESKPFTSPTKPKPTASGTETLGSTGTSPQKTTSRPSTAGSRPSSALTKGASRASAGATPPTGAALLSEALVTSEVNRDAAEAALTRTPAAQALAEAKGEDAAQIEGASHAAATLYANAATGVHGTHALQHALGVYSNAARLAARAPPGAAAVLEALQVYAWG